MNRPISGDAVLGDRRAIGSSGAPLIDQSANSVDVVRVGIEHGIDVPRRSHDSMANQRYSPNQHIADPCAV